MMPSSIGGRLLLLLVGLLGATLFATTFAALKAASDNVTSLLSEELVVREGMVQYALRGRADALRERVEILTADYAFKEAVASRERSTVLSALANHGDRLDADLVMLLDSEGDVTLSSVPAEAMSRSISDVLQNPSVGRSRTVLQVADGRLYLTVVSAVRAPNLLGWLLIGEELDIGVLGELAQLTAAELTLKVEGAPGGEELEDTLLVSTLPFAQELAAVTPGDLGAALHERGWLSRPVKLDRVNLPGSEVVHLGLALSLTQALADYNPLRVQLVLIAVLALILAAVLALAAARWLTRPITAMVSVARRIANGEYTTSVEVSSGTELDTLADALTFMQSTVAEREARIVHQAQHDLLTQLPNRNYLYSLYQQYLLDNPSQARFGIALLEIENIAQVRDLYGAAFSDQVLRAVARTLTDSLRRGDMAGRVGDQQILLFLQDVDQDGIGIVLDKIDRQQVDLLQIDGIPVRLDLRFGFAFSPAHGAEFDELQRRAQIALSTAQGSGLPYATYVVGQDESHLRQIRIANRLQEALAEDAFHLLYQPKFCLHRRAVIGAEALIRWEDRELGRVFPDEFIGIAEQTGVITQLSRWVVQRVIEDQVRWRRAGTEIAVSVNLSGLDVLQADFIDAMLADIARSGLPVDALVLEVTETAMMSDTELARANMERVEKLGMRISIDDYGTGFSSLAQLRSLPVRELKLDRSLVENIDEEAGDRLIVQSTIDMAHHLGLEVVAEGVETPAVLALLSEMGCDVIQGYLLAKPMERNQLDDFLTMQRSNISHIFEALRNDVVA